MARRSTRSGRAAVSEGPPLRILLHDLVTGYRNEPPVFVLHFACQTTDDPGAELVRLAAHDPDDSIAAAAMTTLVKGLHDSHVPDDARDAIIDGALYVIGDALTDRSVGAGRKHMLGTIAMTLDAEADDPRCAEHWVNIQDAIKRVATEAIDALSDDPQAIEHVMEGFGLSEAESSASLSPDEWAGMAMTGVQMGQLRPECGASVLCAVSACAVEAGVDPGPFVEAIGAFEEHVQPAVAWHLRELSAWPLSGPVGERAAAAVESMRRAGVEPQRTFLPQFSHGCVSMVDGAGSRSLMLFFRTPEGGMDGLALLLNDRIGVKDVWCLYDDSSDLEEAVRDNDRNLSYAPCTIELARDLLADAWALHERIGRPVPGRLMPLRIYLGEQPLAPRSRHPDLGAYMIETMVLSLALVKGSEQLIDYAPYGGQWFASDEAYAFVAAHAPKRGPARLSKKNLRRFIEQVVPSEMPQLLRRMALNLEVESIAGRALQRVNQIAAQTWLAMTEGICNPADVPFIGALAEESAPLIIENLRRGHRNQDDANRAALDQDEAMAEMFQGAMSELMDLLPPELRE